MLVSIKVFVIIYGCMKDYLKLATSSLMSYYGYLLDHHHHHPKFMGTFIQYDLEAIDTEHLSCLDRTSFVFLSHLFFTH